MWAFPGSREENWDFWPTYIYTFQSYYVNISKIIGQQYDLLPHRTGQEKRCYVSHFIPDYRITLTNNVRWTKWGLGDSQTLSLVLKMTKMKKL